MTLIQLDEHRSQDARMRRAVRQHPGFQNLMRLAREGQQRRDARLEQQLVALGLGGDLRAAVLECCREYVRS